MSSSDPERILPRYDKVDARAPRIGTGGRFVLGLDVGASSVGWALLGLDDSGEPRGVIACGARTFKAGVEGNLADGRDEPRGVARRLARQQRRQAARRVQRKRRVYRALMDAGLLPQTDVVNHFGIDVAIRDLDVRLRAAWIPVGDHRGQLTYPYQLRAAASRSQLSAEPLGRAVYHLAQRRGFLSNRKTRAREDEEGVVKEGIADLKAEMEAAGHATLGEHFASLDPRVRRIRNRYTHRGMFEREFKAIAEANAWVSAEAWASIRKAIFFQRKLKSSSHLVGRCECVPSARRAPMWHPSFQRYRILEQVANLRVTEPGAREERPLTADERGVLINHLTHHKDVSAAGVKRVLKLKGAALSIESIGASKLIGDRTAAAMRTAFGTRWDAMPERERMSALLDVHSFEKVESLCKRAERHWRLQPKEASALAEVQLEHSYASLSVKAIDQLRPHLELGLNARQAIDIEFPGRFRVGQPVEVLPSLREAMPELRNPAVARALTEVRRIVNRVLERWGRPEVVRIELARDLKRSRMHRERIAKDNRSQERVRAAAAERILREANVASPRRSDIEKMLLADECEFTCPYTGRRFGMHDLFGEHPLVDVEHIIPFGRSLDDSFANKTLCFVDENRTQKRNRTPYEAYGHDPTRWEEIIGRVERFRGVRAQAKLVRFQMTEVGPEVLAEFADRQLNDTRFASKMAAHFIARLFGGLVDSAGSRRVQASSGAVTARLRQAWRMGFALHDDGLKNRADHRHHALDAIAVALSSPSIVKRMADAAQRGTQAGRDGRLLEFSEPWPGFLEDVREAIQNVVASHRPDRRLAGALHEETNYSRPLKVGDKLVHRRRKPIAAVKETDMKSVADSALRAAVGQARADALRQSTAHAAGPQVHPSRPDRVRRLRVAADRTPVLLEARKGRRWVAPGSNHHMAIFEVTEGASHRWEVEVVTRLEAHRRHRSGEPIVRRDRGDGSRFLFSIRSGDTIRLKGKDGQPMFVVVRGVSVDVIEAVAANDARPAQEIRDAGAAGGRMKLTPSALRRQGAERVDISPIGEITVARD
jgi:CRISPR-associated endonuclease Csn1